MIKRFLILLLVGISLGACQEREKGVFEKAGEEIDDTINDSTEKDKSVGDKIGEDIRELGDDIEDKS